MDYLVCLTVKTVCSNVVQCGHNYVKTQFPFIDHCLKYIESITVFSQP